VAMSHLETALSGDQQILSASYFDDLLRLLRLAHARGFGEKLIAWFDESGHADRQAPVYAAFVAFVRGEQFLRDVNPEVRAPAEKIYQWLMRLRNRQRPSGKPDDGKPKRRRGRPPKRRGH
jgi:hypothetical protein